jgi:hypothetical protein
MPNLLWTRRMMRFEYCAVYATPMFGVDSIMTIQ